MVLAHAVADNRITVNPADHVKLPNERTENHSPGVIDDPSQFLTAQQVAALVDATPWPFRHLRSSRRVVRPAGRGTGRIADRGYRIARRPNETGFPSRGAHRHPHSRRIGLRLAEDERLSSPGAVDWRHCRDAARVSDFPSPPKRTGCAVVLCGDQPARRVGSVGGRTSALALDWSALLNHLTFYRVVFRPAVARANQTAQTDGLGDSEILPPNLTFHALRHTYASLCVAAGIPPLAISRFMGHSKVTTTLGIYTHLFQDDHSDAMTALAALSRPVAAPNVVPMRRRG